MNCLPVMYNRGRYDDYFLVADEPMDIVGFDERPKKCCSRRSKIIVITIFISILVLLFLVVYVVFPLVFMCSIQLQRTLIFTRLGQNTESSYYENYTFPSYKNEYLNYTNTNDNSTMSLGTWHILPVPLSYEALHDETFDFQMALSNSSFSVLIYFHGTGETRASSHRKYQLLTQLFHVIAFDYRNYGDSKPDLLSEKNVVRDCIEICLWIKNRTSAPIYIWGHSLGAALAAETAAYLKRHDIPIKGLILESGFTSLREELYVHPYGKLFAWLPWFKFTVLNPLRRNNFIFNTANNIQNLTCPIMILHAQDDRIVPVKFGRKLYEIASNRTIPKNYTVYHEFKENLEYGHIFIYEDPFLIYYVMDFLLLT